jgi:hypothetical protein
MQVLVNEFGERVQIYRPYINREEEARNVSIFVPESSQNTGLYNWEQVNHLTGNSWPGRWTDETNAAHYWWGMDSKSKPITPSEASQGPGVYASPRNTFLAPKYGRPDYRRLSSVYGVSTNRGAGGSRLALYS